MLFNGNKNKPHHILFSEMDDEIFQTLESCENLLKYHADLSVLLSNGFISLSKSRKSQSSYLLNNYSVDDFTQQIIDPLRTISEDNNRLVNHYDTSSETTVNMEMLMKISAGLPNKDLRMSQKNFIASLQVILSIVAQIRQVHSIIGDQLSDEDPHQVNFMYDSPVAVKIIDGLNRADECNDNDIKSELEIGGVLNGNSSSSSGDDSAIEHNINEEDFVGSNDLIDDDSSDED